MPGHRFLNDADLATILTFIRQHFGNAASDVTPEEVQVRRGEEP